MSLVGTFVFVKAFGFSINTLTLFGIALATGLVVDDAIVVIENIERNIGEPRATPSAAAGEAMAEVAGAVIATSLVLVAVFVPVAFSPGTTGRLYRQFSLTIAFSVAISAFNALTLSPALAALLLRPERERHFALFRWFNRGFEATRERYRRGARLAASPPRLAWRCLRRRPGPHLLDVPRRSRRVRPRRGSELLHRS